MNFWLRIKPVSANAYYQAVRGRVIISEAGRNQKEYIHNFLRSNNAIKIEGNIELSVVCFYKDNRTRDIDNVLKPLIDCLKDVCFGDDSLIQKITIEKKKHLFDCVYIQINSHF